MASVLVTGATGFIGQALCRSLRARGQEIVELSTRDGDIAEPATLAKLGPVFHVYHLAGRTFVPDSWLDPVEFHRINVLGTANVLEFCRAQGARLTFVSAYLYGVPTRLPVSEDCVPKPNNPYALSKLLAEQLCAFHAAHHGLDVAVVRPFNIFGSGQKPHFLIPEIVRQVKQRRPIRVKDLAPRRDYLHVDDLVEALVKASSGPGGYNVFNIGSGVSFSVGELIGMIQSVWGVDLPVSGEGSARHNEIDDVYADTRRARELLGWTPSLTIRQGFERMMNQESVR